MAAAGRKECKVCPGEYLPRIQNPGINILELSSDIQELRLSGILSFPTALEGNLKAQGAGAVPFFRYVEYRHIHRTAGAEAAITCELPSCQTDESCGIHNPRNIRAAIRHNALPHDFTGKGWPGHPLVVVMAGLFQFQFHIWRPPFAYIQGPRRQVKPPLPPLYERTPYFMHGYRTAYAGYHAADGVISRPRSS